VLGSLANAVGIDHWNLFGHLQMLSTGKNEFRDSGNVRGLFFTSPELPADHPMNGSMALMTTDSSITAKPYWHQGDWWDCIHDLWDDFCADGMVEREPVSARTASDKRPKIGSLGIRHTLAPGETRAFEFLLAWHFPSRPRGWSQETWQVRFQLYHRELLQQTLAGRVASRRVPRERPGSTREFE
jgi:hypothetical protein